MSGPGAGQYDPVKAIIQKPVRSETPSGTPLPESWETYCERHIKPLNKTTLDARREQSQLSQTKSRDLMGFRMRNDRITAQIQPDMRLTHRGNTWEIVGVDFIDYAQDEVQILCQRVNVPRE